MADLNLPDNAADGSREQPFHPAIGQEYASIDGRPHCSGNCSGRIVGHPEVTHFTRGALNVCSPFFAWPSDDEPGAVFGPPPASDLAGMDPSLTPSEHVLRRDVADSTVQAEVIVRSR